MDKDYELRLKAINLAYYIFCEEFKKDYTRKSNEITQEMDNLESNCNSRNILNKTFHLLWLDCASNRLLLVVL